MSDASPPANKADKTPADDAPEPIQHGPLGKALADKGLTLEALGDDAVGNETLGVACADLLGVAKALRDDGFDLLLSVSGMDYKEYRQSVTHLYSTKTYQTVTLKTDAGGDDTVPSLVPIWPAADWHERESYDLMGIHYEGHPDLRRILMPIDWIGHPLRKDYKEEDPRLVWNRR